MATTKTAEKKPTKKTTEKTVAKKTSAKKAEKSSVEKKTNTTKKSTTKKTSEKKIVSKKETNKELSVSTIDSKLTVKYGNDEIIKTSQNSKVYFFEDILKQKIKEKCVVAVTVFSSKIYIVVNKNSRHLRKSPAAVADLLTTVAAQRKKIIKELES